MKKKKNYMLVDTSKIKFVENSESEDVEFEDDVNSSNVENFNSVDDTLSDSNNESSDLKSTSGKKKKKKKKSFDDSDSDSDNDNDNDNGGDEDKDDEVENEKDDDFIKISWEKDKRNYYQYESENSSSDNEENDERIKEAIYLNKKEKENLNENDFDLCDIYMTEKEDKILEKKKGGHGIDEEENIIKRLISDVSKDLKGKKNEITLEGKNKKEIEQIVMSEQQEYKILLKELSSNIQKVFNEINDNKKLFEFKEIDENNVSPSDINKNTLLYLKKKNETMLTYIIYITYYVFLKIMNCYTHNHPVLDKLIYMNTIISKTNDLDSKIKFKIQQLNKSSGRELDELGSSKKNGETISKKVKMRENVSKGANELELDDVEEDSEDEDNVEDEDDVNDTEDNDEEVDDEEVNDEEVDDEEVDDEEVDDEEDDGDEDDDEEDDGDEDDEAQDGEVNGDNEKYKNKKYKISKSLITEYTDSHIREKEKEEKKKKREKIKNERNVFLKEIKDMVSNRPEKIEEHNYMKKMEEKLMHFDEKILNKKIKALNKKKNKLNNLSNVGMTSNDLLKFVELPEMNQEEKNKNLEEKKIFRSNINKIKQMKKNKLTNNVNDDFVSFKKFDKINSRYTSYKSEDYNNSNNAKFGKNIYNEIDDEKIKSMISFKKKRKENKKLNLEQKNREIRKKLVDEENEISDRRIPNKNIIQNKGLVRKRKSTDGNARVHNKIKFMKKMKTYNSQHPKLKVHENNYSGEKRGINPYLKKSIDIK
ncbi:small subunit rRNA processing factor, putative [Plasmodium malariae]|uniref:Small subunit rRNA processing factor, putative n=2 Tax=Plasmodium (Plasmodium) TaxID=418103 RepID=A0A1A8W1V2_PLAMA|nr:small subunit rRNA processing factor, putative [Plasmodium malariae]